MSLRVTTYSRSREFNTLTHCPFCGYDFDPGESRLNHIADEHGPEDAGLSPLGEVFEDSEKPLFGGDAR